MEEFLPKAAQTPPPPSLRQRSRAREISLALHNSEKRYRSLYDENPSICFTVDPAGKVLSVNKFGAAYLGYSARELAGRSVLSIFHQDDRASVRSHLRTCLAQPGKVYQWELRKVRKDGTELWVKETARSIYISGDEPMVLIVCEDITQRRQAEEALRLILQATAPAVGVDYFKSLVRHLASALRVRSAFVAELSEQVDDCQRARILAWWAGSDFGRNFEYALAGTPCEKVFTANGAYYPSRVQARFPNDRWLRENGIENYLAVPVYNPAGDPVGHLGVMHDAPMADDVPRKAVLGIFASRVGAELERNNAERALRRHERMVSASRDMMAFVDRNFSYLAVNTSYAEAFGRPEDAIVGRDVSDVVGADIFVQRIKPYMDRCLAGEQVNYQHWMQLPAKGLRYLDVHFDPFFDANGKVSGVVEDIRDLTERKQAETTLHRYQQQLRNLAAEMSLAEERERRRIAVELHDRIVQDLALSQIKLGALREALASTPHTADAKAIQTIINQIISDTRSLVFELSPPILYELGFEPAIEWLGERLQEHHGIDCRVQNDGQLKKLDKDLQVVLFQAVRELLVNVTKHANAKRARIRLWKEANKILIHLEDDGVGFDVSAVAPSAVEHTGFGLFSIRERLSMSGGQLEIDSAPGKGTRVTLTVPMASTPGR